MHRGRSQTFFFFAKIDGAAKSELNLFAKIDGAAGVDSGCVCLGFGARTCIATRGMAQ